MVDYKDTPFQSKKKLAGLEGLTTQLTDTKNDLKVRNGVNIKSDFGATGAGLLDDSQSLRNALSYVNSSATINTIFFPPGDYYFATNVTNYAITKNIYLIGDNVRIFMKYDDNNSISSQYSILSLGISVLSTTDIIPSDIKKGTRFINVTDTTNFKVGQLVEIKSNENYAIRPIPYTEYKKGYITVVQSVTTGSGITVADKAPYDFTALNNSLQCIIRNDNANKGINIEGLSFEWVNTQSNTRTAPSTCVQISNSSNSYVKRCRFENMHIGLQVFSGYNINLDEIKIESPTIPSVASDYGISSSSHNIAIERVISNTSNTSINFSGSPGIGNRIKNSRLTSITGRPITSHCCNDLTISDTILNGKGFLELSGTSFIFEGTTFNISDQMIIVNKEAKSFDYLKLKSCKVNYDFISAASALVMFNGSAITKTAEVVLEDITVSGEKIEYLVWYNNINPAVSTIGNVNISNSVFENMVEYPVYWSGTAPNALTKKAFFSANNNKFNDTNIYFSDTTGYGSLLFGTVIFENNKKLREESILGFHAYAVDNLTVKNNDIFRSRRGTQYYPVRIERCTSVAFTRNTIKGDERGAPGAECYFGTIANLLLSDNILVDTVRATAFSVNGSNVTFDNNYVNKAGVVLLSHSTLTGYRSRTSIPLSVRPANAEKGTPIYDTAINKPISYNGTAWTDGVGTVV